MSFFLEQIFECMLTIFFYLSTRFVDVIFFFFNLQSDVQKKKNLNYPIKKKRKHRGAQGAIIFRIRDRGLERN